jgi:hypothetical protein
MMCIRALHESRNLDDNDGSNRWLGRESLRRLRADELTPAVQG